MTDKVQQFPGTTRKVSRMSHDWEEIERDYRAGIKSISQIAREQDISRAAIHARARRRGWQRDLSVQVQQRAKEKLAREAALEAVREVGREVGRTFTPEMPPGGTADRAADGQAGDQEIVELNAEAIVHVIRGHRRDLARIRRTLSRLHAPLEQFLDTLEAWQEGEPSPEISLRLSQVMGPRETLGDLTIKLTRALTTLIPLERRAFGLDERDPTEAVDLETLGENDRAIIEEYRTAVAQELKQEMAAG